MINFKELAHVIVEAGKFKISTLVGQATRLGTSGKTSMLQVRAEGRIPSLGKGGEMRGASKAFN